MSYELISSIAILMLLVALLCEYISFTSKLRKLGEELCQQKRRTKYWYDGYNVLHDHIYEVYNKHTVTLTTGDLDDDKT